MLPAIHRCGYIEACEVRALQNCNTVRVVLTVIPCLRLPTPMDVFLEPTAILVGDELGQLKKIDLLKNDLSIITLKPEEPVHPSRSVASIEPLNTGLVKNDFLIANKRQEIFIFDALTDEVKEVRYNATNQSPLVGSCCVDDQNIVVGFRDGSFCRVNIERDLCAAKYKPKPKALDVLGIEDDQLSQKRSKKRRRNETLLLNSSKIANDTFDEKPNVFSIFKSNWNSDSMYLTCFKISGGKLAFGGVKSDLKVIDITTSQNIFTAKPTRHGIGQDIWLSGLDWIGHEGDFSNLIATCSRTESCVRIYDVKERQKKPIMEIDIKKLNLTNVEANSPSLTTICSLPSISNFASSSTSLIFGTTTGRMVAMDLRMNTRRSKVLGSFKGFCGGSIRDIKFARDSRISHKVISCSLDRFVRLHSLTKTSRVMDKKVYVKTRPTCIQPVVSQVINSGTNEENDFADSDEFY